MIRRRPRAEGCSDPPPTRVLNRGRYKYLLFASSPIVISQFNNNNSHLSDFILNFFSLLCDNEGFLLGITNYITSFLLTGNDFFYVKAYTIHYDATKWNRLIPACDQRMVRHSFEREREFVQLLDSRVYSW